MTETLIIVSYMNGTSEVFHKVNPDSIFVRDGIVTWEDYSDDIHYVPLCNVRHYTTSCKIVPYGYEEPPF